MTNLQKPRNLYAMVVDPRGYTPPYDQALCHGLAEAGCRVMLATAEHSELDWKFGESFSRWNRFCELTSQFPTDGSCSVIHKTMQAFDYAVSLKKFVRLVHREQPDVIHFQWLAAPLLDQVCLSLLRKQAKLILTLHNTTLFHGAVSKYRALGLRTALRQVDAIVVHTNFSRQRLLEKSWVEESRIHVIPHGAFAHYRSVPFQESEVARPKRLLFFGNLQPYKGLDTLLLAFAQIEPKLRQTTRLVIAGRPIMETQPLFDLARRLGIQEQIDWILRPITEEEVCRLFSQATAVALPYREIDQSGVLMTAIACGKPVIATAAGGIPETVQDGVHGYLVPRDDPEAFAAAASRLLASDQRVRQMGEAMQRLSAGRLAWSNIAALTSNLYRKLLGEPSPASIPAFAAREAA